MVNTLELKNISFSYKKDTFVLKNLNVKFTGGKINALLGINGSGKTTLFKILTGIYKPLTGSIYYNNVLINSNNIIAFKENLGFMPEFLYLYKNLSVTDVLKMLAELKGYSNYNLSNILETVFLYEHRNKKIKALSKGMKQRLNLAQAIIGDPKIVLFDEPSNGFDCGSITMFYTILKKLTSNNSIVLLSSHHLTEIHGNVDNVIVLSNTNIIKELDVESIDEDEGLSKEVKISLLLPINIIQQVSLCTKFPYISVKNDKKKIYGRVNNKIIIDIIIHLISLNIDIKDIKINDKFLEDMLLDLS